MRVSLVRSGGVAGMRRAAALDTDLLDPVRAAELRRLVEAADLATLSEPTIRTAADRFRYTLTIEDGARLESLTFDEERIPERLVPLIELLWREAWETPEPPGTRKA